MACDQSLRQQLGLALLSMDNVGSSQLADYEPSFKKSKPSHPTKVCVICLDGDYIFFIVDLKNEGRGDCEFIARLPNIRLQGFHAICFCVVDSTVYMFKSCDSWASYSESDSRSVYSYKLLENVSEMSNFIVDKNMVVNACPLQHAKVHSEAIRYGSGILVFSTIIKLDTRLIDFELYTLGHQCNRSTSLPALCIRRVPCSHDGCCSCIYEEFCLYELFDTIENIVLDTFVGSNNRGPPEFDIRGYGLIDGGNTFLVKTSLCQMFKLDLQSPTVWRIYKDNWIVDYDNQFFVIENRFYVDTYGLYDMNKLDAETKFKLWSDSIVYDGLDEDYVRIVKHKFEYEPAGAQVNRLLDGIDARVYFQGSSFEGVNICHASSEITFLDDSARFACIVQFAKDESTDYPHLTVDLMELDLSKFSEAEEEEKDWAKHVRSLKFFMKKRCWHCLIMNVYPVKV